MDNKKKKFNTNRVAAYALSGVMLASVIPYNVFATQEKAEEAVNNNFEISAEPTPAAQQARNENLPGNRIQKLNWEEELKKDDRNWAVDLDGGQKLVRVGTSDATQITDINYDGTYVDANGRTNIRLIYSEKSAAATTVWFRALLKFDPDLYEKVDWENSFALAANGEKFGILTSNGKYEKNIDIGLMSGLKAQGRQNLPINLVLKKDVDIKSLGEKNYLIQMRVTDANNKRIYAFAPGDASMDYSTYTKGTVIPLANNIDTEFLRGGQVKKSPSYAVQRAFFSEFIANPSEFPDSSNMGIIRTQYLAQRGIGDPKNTQDDKPAAFVQMFDAKLVKYLKADANGNIAYTNLLNDKRKENADRKIGITKDDINYTKDGKFAYFVIGQSNFQKDGVKVVRLEKFDKLINTGGFYVTAIDYVVDKKEFANTFTQTDRNKADFSLMTGWVDSNPKGWTIFEKDYNKNLVIPAGEKFLIDVTQVPEGGQILVQIGDIQDSIIRRPQGYYNGSVSGTGGIFQFEESKTYNGMYEITLREGTVVKPGDKLRVYMPDTASHDHPVSIFNLTNGTEIDKGAATLTLSKDRKILTTHIYKDYKVDKGYYKVRYTPKGQTQETSFNIEIVKAGLGVKWQETDKNMIKGLPNRAVTTAEGNFQIDLTKVEPGTDIIVESYNSKGELQEGETSTMTFDRFKEVEKYTNLAWTDSTDNLSLLTLKKSVYRPYQDIFTNDYKMTEAASDAKHDINQIYRDPRSLPASEEEFKKNTEKVQGFTRYDGGSIRLLYVDEEGNKFIAKANAKSNVYDDKGNLKTDVTKLVKPEGLNKEHSVFPYDVYLKFNSSRATSPVEGETFELKKDMRLLFNTSDGSSIPSDWMEERVKTRVLFNTTDGEFEGGKKQDVRIVPDNVRYASDAGYVANGFTGANVQAGTGDGFADAPTAEGKTFLGWVTEAGKTALGNKTVTTAAAFNNLKADQKFTDTTPITTHQVVYAIWSEQKLVTFNANGGKFDDGSTTKTDDIKDGVQAPTPTQEGKEFVGWASKPDATKADVTDLSSLTEGTTVYAVWKDAKTEKTADKVQPSYTDADAQVGESTTITAPNFKDAKEQDTTIPEGTKFALGENAPEGAKINPDTGEITYTPANGTAGTEVKIPVVVNYKDGSTDKVDATVAVAEAKTQADETTPVVPEKTKVADKTNLTKDEKDAVKKAVEDANKDKFPQAKEGQQPTKVEVGADGTATITYPDGSVDTIKGTDLVEEKAPAGELTIKEPANKVPVAKKDALTKEEKQAVKDAIKAANPDLGLTDDDITVDEKGNVTVAKDGKEGKLPADKVVEEKAKTTADKTDPKKPTEKTEVADKTNLTDTEKAAVKKAIEDANKDDQGKSTLPAGTEITVGNDGTATITYPDKSTDTIKGSDLTEEKAKTQADKRPLQNEVDKKDDTKASDKYKNADKDKKEAYDKALDDAKKVLEDPKATQDDVNKAKKALVEAEKALNGKTTSDTDNTGGNDGYRPGHDGRDIFDRLFRRHDYTPTYPVKTVVPEKTEYGTPVRDTLWYVFHINEFQYEVVRNGVVTKRLMDVTPVLQNGRTMLPLRYVAEALQADVTWDAKTRTATFTKDGLTASIQIDSDEIVLSNGKTVKMDSKPLNINDRILVSVTNVANVFGLTNGNTKDKADQDIEWEQQDKSATIYIRR